MTEIRDIAEPLHQERYGLLSTNDPKNIGVDGVNAGIDALVDAVEQQGFILISEDLAAALVRDMHDLDLSHGFHVSNWPAAREFIVAAGARGAFPRRQALGFEELR